MTGPNTPDPYMPLWVTDVRGDPALAECSEGATGVWVLAMCAMWLSPRRGFLLMANGAVPQKKSEIGRVLNRYWLKTGRFLDELLTKKALFRVSECDSSSDRFPYLLGAPVGAIYSRRMAHDAHKSRIRALAGSEGGKQRASKHAGKSSGKSGNKIQANSGVEWNGDLISESMGAGGNGGRHPQPRPNPGPLLDAYGQPIPTQENTPKTPPPADWADIKRASGLGAPRRPVGRPSRGRVPLPTQGASGSLFDEQTEPTT